MLGPCMRDPIFFVSTSSTPNFWKLPYRNYVEPTHQMEVSVNRGLQNRPQYIMMLFEGTPKKRPLLLETPGYHVLYTKKPYTLYHIQPRIYWGP